MSLPRCSCAFCPALTWRRTLRAFPTAPSLDRHALLDPTSGLALCAASPPCHPSQAPFSASASLFREFSYFLILILASTYVLGAPGFLRARGPLMGTLTGSCGWGLSSPEAWPRKPTLGVAHSTMGEGGAEHPAWWGSEGTDAKWGTRASSGSSHLKPATWQWKFIIKYPQRATQQAQANVSHRPWTARTLAGPQSHRPVMTHSTKRNANLVVLGP